MRWEIASEDDKFIADLRQNSLIVSTRCPFYINELPKNIIRFYVDDPINYVGNTKNMDDQSIAYDLFSNLALWKILDSKIQ